MEMPRYSFRLKKEDAKLQSRIEKDINDSKRKSSEVIREILYKGFEAEQNPESQLLHTNTGTSSDDVKELKELVLHLIEQQNKLINEVHELKQQDGIRQPIHSTSPVVASNEEVGATVEVKEDSLELSETEEKMGDMVLDFFDQF